MTKKTRTIILVVCILSFSVISPLLVFYSMGDRFDFEKMKITKTGGIYVRTFPPAEEIIIDSKTIEKPGLFSNSIFVQSLLPNLHTVLVKKTGFYDYFKTIPVIEKQVTKIENILLFKKDVKFSILTPSTDPETGTQSPFTVIEKYIIKSNNLYYSSSLENYELSAIQKATPIIKKISAFSLRNNSVIWLGTDGFLYTSDLSNMSVTPIKMILTPIKMAKTGIYKVITDNNNTFVINNGNLLILDTGTNTADELSTLTKDVKISPDGKNVIYYNDNNIYLSPLKESENYVKDLKTPLYKSSDKISQCFWINNDYIIFTDGNKIIISEIDYRGNINIITFPQTINILEQAINIIKPQIIFNQQEGKVYVLTGKTVISSEKILP